MKIKIGKYPNTWLRCQIHYDYMNKKYDHDWDENKTKFESILEKIEDTIQSIYNVTINQIIKYRKRKIKVRIDPSDTWCMDNTLAHIILPMLKQLKATKHGAPLVDDKDVPVELRSSSAPPKENEWDTDANHFKRWDWVIDEMIHAFECELNEDWEDQFHSGKIDMRWKKDEENPKFSTMYYGPDHTHKFDKKGYDKAWARRNNGLRLFGKYYHGLWD